MWTEVVLGFILIALVAKFLSQRMTSSEKGKSKIPGMDPTDKRGNKSDMEKAKTVPNFLHALHKKYGPIASFWEGDQMSISVATPELLKQQRSLFNFPYSFNREFEIILGNEALPFKNGDEAKRRRRIYDQYFMLKACKMYKNIFIEVAEEYVKNWKALLATDNRISMNAQISRAALTAISRTSFGDYFKNVDNMIRFQTITDWMFTNVEPIPIPGTEKYKQFIKYREEVKSVVKHLIEERRRTNTSNDEELFIDVLINNGFSEEERLAETLTFIAAGYTTVSSVITWALYSIAKYPSIQDKLHAEVEYNFQDGKFTEDSFAKFKYLRQILDETMRMYPGAQYVTRITDNEMEIGGYLVPKNTAVYQMFNRVYKDPKIFPNPDKFDPDRFTEEAIRSRHAFAFKPFGFAGKRHCPGQTFAYAKSIIFIAEWVHNFRFSLVPGQKVRLGEGITVWPEDEIWFILEKRN